MRTIHDDPDQIEKVRENDRELKRAMAKAQAEAERKERAAANELWYQRFNKPRRK